MLVRKIQAHRGFSEVYPENTMLAFREAVKAGAGGIEMDVRRTADHEFIMMHDFRVDRTTNGTGFIERLSYKEYLKILDAGSWKGEAFANREDTKIPALPQVLDEFEHIGVTLILHVKDDSSEVVNFIHRRNMLEQVVFFGSQGVINRIKSMNKNAFTQNDGAPGPDAYERVLQNAIFYRHNAVSVSPATVTQEMVDQIKSHRKLVHCSFLSSDYEANTRHLIDLGVDFILGNDARRMIQALKEGDVH